MTTTGTPHIQLQACLGDPNGESEYRFLVDGKDIKYITVDQGVIPNSDLGFEPALREVLPVFPPGDWNEGHVAKDSTTGKAVFSSTTRRTLPGVQNVWHSQTTDHLQLVWVDRMRQNVRVVNCPGIDHPVIYKFAEFPWQTPSVETETTAYSWIDGHGIGPSFLGHIAEDGRVIGFLVEKIQGRTATVSDLEACQRVLAKLHALGIQHGDVNKHNFLITETGSAVLLDFECAAKCNDEQALLKEYESLQEQLVEDTGRGGTIVGFGEFRPVNNLDGSTSHPAVKRRVASSPLPPSTPKRRKQDALPLTEAWARPKDGQRHSDADSDISVWPSSEPRRFSPSIQSSGRDSIRDLRVNQGEYRQCEGNVIGRNNHRTRRHRKRAMGDRPPGPSSTPGVAITAAGAQGEQQKRRRRPVDVSDEDIVDVDDSDGDGVSVSKTMALTPFAPPKKKVNTELSVILPVSKQRYRSHMEDISDTKAKSAAWKRPPIQSESRRPLPSSPPDNDGVDELSTEYYSARPSKRLHRGENLDDGKPGGRPLGSKEKAAAMSPLIENIVHSPLRVRAAVRTPAYTYACGSKASVAPTEGELEMTVDPQQPRVLLPADKNSFWLRVDLREARVVSTNPVSSVVIVDLPEKEHASGRLGSRLGIQFHGPKDARRLISWASEFESGTGFKMREGVKLDRQFERLVSEIESRKPVSAGNSVVDLSASGRARSRRSSPEASASFSTEKSGVESILPSRTRSGRAGRESRGQATETVDVDATGETPGKSREEAKEAPASTDSRLARLRNRNARSRPSPWSSFEDLPVERWTEKHPDWARNWRVPLTYARTTVDKDDVARLDEGQFLNDNIINFYLQFLQGSLKMSDSGLASRVYFHNTFFYEKLKPNRGQAISFDGIKRWTAKVDLFSYDYIVVPVNDQLHWWVAIICNVPKILEAAMPESEAAPDVAEARTPQQAGAVNPDTEADAEMPSDDFLPPKTTPRKESISPFLHSRLSWKEEQTSPARVDKPKRSPRGEEFAIVLKSVERDEDGDSQAQKTTPGDETKTKVPSQSPRAQQSSSRTGGVAVDTDKNGDAADDDDDVEVTEIRGDLATGTAEAAATPAKRAFAGGRGKNSKKVFMPSSKNRDPKDPRIFTLDSLGTTHAAAVDHLKQWLLAEIATRKAIEPRDPGRLGMTAKAIPEQENFCDCGVYLLLYIQEFIRDPDGFIEDIVLKRERKWETAASAMRSQLRELILHKQEEFQAAEEANKKPKKKAVPAADQTATTASTGVAAAAAALERAGTGADASTSAKQRTPTTPTTKPSAVFDRTVPNSQSVQESSSPRPHRSPVPPQPEEVDEGGYESAEVDMVFQPIGEPKQHEGSSVASSLGPMEPFVSSPLERTSPAPYDLPGHPQQG